jgi:hypothetical protein
MRALADFAVDDLLERVDALRRVRGVGDEHEMHAVRVLAIVPGGSASHEACAGGLVAYVAVVMRVKLSVGF